MEFQSGHCRKRESCASRPEMTRTGPRSRIPRPPARSHRLRVYPEKGTPLLNPPHQQGRRLGRSEERTSPPSNRQVVFVLAIAGGRRLLQARLGPTRAEQPGRLADDTHRATGHLRCQCFARATSESDGRYSLRIGDQRTHTLWARPLTLAGLLRTLRETGGPEGLSPPTTLSTSGACEPRALGTYCAVG
jgi:hypothetical protein